MGQRLALAARALVYGERLAYSGPSFESYKVDGNRVVVSFGNVEDGLSTREMILENTVQDPRVGPGSSLHVAKNSSKESATRLQGFTISGEDRKFVNAEATIVGNTVVVSSPEVITPAAVRYGWADYPSGNLFNSAGLPSSPFRTDDWPLKNR